MSQRNPEAIKNDIAAVKEAFDAAIFDGEFYDHYSRMSLRHQWARLQETIAPLCEELKKAEIYYRLMEDEHEQQLYLMMRKRKGRSAA